MKIGLDISALIQIANFLCLILILILYFISQFEGFYKSARKSSKASSVINLVDFLTITKTWS